MGKKSIWNQCGKKNRYRDEHTVNYYRRILGEEHNVKLDYYWCPYCNGYHLTSEEFRPEGYGLIQNESGEWIHIERNNSDGKKSVAITRAYFMGRKNRIRMNADELERMYAV